MFSSSQAETVAAGGFFSSQLTDSSLSSAKVFCSFTFLQFIIIFFFLVFINRFSFHINLFLIPSFFVCLFVWGKIKEPRCTAFGSSNRKANK